MDNFVLDGRMSAVSSNGVITKFRAKAAWVDGAPERGNPTRRFAGQTFDEVKGR